MLISFVVSNFRSIKDMQEFSLLTSKIGQKEGFLNRNFMFCDGEKEPLGKLSGFYGANASGKSNFIKALNFMKHLVLTSHRNLKSKDLPYEPYVLDEEHMNTPSEFEVTFLNNSTKYIYGFSLNKERVIEEWAYFYPSGRKSLLFLREIGEDSQYNYHFGSLLKGQKSVIVQTTNKESLFLSKASDIEECPDHLKSIFSWFSDTLRILSMDIDPFTYAVEMWKTKEDCHKFILKLLSLADTGVKGVEIEERSVLDQIPELPFAKIQKLFQLCKEEFELDPNTDLNDKVTIVKAFHDFRKNNGLIESKAFQFTEESAGTKRFFGFSAILLDIISNERVIFIDEIESSMHPLLVVRFLESFLDLSQEKLCQLIFTTHNTHLLNSDVLLRDQIWFVEKDKEMASHIYSLLEYTPRKGEYLEKWYLLGKYGAIPFLQNFEDIEDHDSFYGECLDVES